MNINPINKDYADLWATNPLAAEQMKVIVLNRTVLEQQKKIAELEAQLAPPEESE